MPITQRPPYTPVPTYVIAETASARLQIVLHELPLTPGPSPAKEEGRQKIRTSLVVAKCFLCFCDPTFLVLKQKLLRVEQGPTKVFQTLAAVADQGDVLFGGNQFL